MNDFVKPKTPHYGVFVYFMRYTTTMRLKTYLYWKIELALKHFKRWLDSLKDV